MCWACSVISRSSMRAAPAPGARLAPVTLPGRGVVVLMPEDPGCLRYQSGGGCETQRGNPLCMCPRGQVSACQSPPPRAGRSAVRRTQAASGGGMLTASSILPASPAGLAADQLLAPWGPCPRIGGVGTSAFSHPGRCRNDAAFASLAGTCPIPASSGHTVRHRLNRGGDRALNRAIHTIATVRMRDCPATQAYIGRRTAEGKPSARSNAASSDAIARDTRCAAARTEGVRLGLEPISEADLAPVDRLMTMLGAGLHLRCSCAGGAGRRTSRDTGPWRHLGDCLSWCA